jgi:hypothetical protein
MNFKQTSLSFAIVLVLTLLNYQAAQADVLRVLEEKVGPIPEFVIPLKAGETVSLETRNLSPGIDPVLHLWDPANRVEIAMDDNGGGGKSAKLTKRVTTAGDFVLIVRPRNFLSSGTTDIFKNGTLFKSAVQVEGWYVFLLSLQPKEQINVLPPPLGAPTHLMYLISEDGLHIESRRRGSPRSRWEIPAEISGARTLLIGVRPADGGRPMRLYRNDVNLPGADPDRDGLGTQLERQLKTCSVATDLSDSFPCDSEHVADLRDTDGDGISDGWEVLGRQFSSEVYVALPTWGSNPRHKDMFVEADYRRLTKAENDAHIAEHMFPEVARQFAASYGDKDTTDPLLGLIHATITGNPDQQPGISVHIDTGLKPVLPEDAAIYGDWGGYDAIDTVLRDGSFVPLAPSELWQTHMDPSRRGIFRYGPGHIRDGGRCGTHVYCGYNFHNVGNTIHEISHTLGLEHTGAPGSGGANCKPNYPSTVNYAYKDDLFVNGVLLSKGHLPSDGRERPPLNNTALRERGGIPILSKSYINDLQTRFKYQVDPLTGNVDWNRDGMIAPAGQTVRAYANYAPGSDCEFTRMNQVKFREIATSLAITRMDPATMVFSVDPSGKVRLRQSFSSWKCPPSEELCAGSSFALATTIIPFAVSTKSLDAEVVKMNGTEEVSLVAIGSDGKLRERRLSFNSSDALKISEERLIPSAIPAAGEPSLAATRDGRGIYLIYKGTDNVLRWRFRNNGIWPAETIAMDPNGLKLVAADEASPGIASAYLPWTPNSTEALYLSYSAASGILGIYSLNAQNRWDSTNLQSDFPKDTIGRPAMAWVPNTTADDAVGQFYLLFRDAENAYRMMRTFFDFDPAQNRIRVGLNSYFDNNWLNGNAIGVTTSSSTGAPQLWAVLAYTRHPDTKPEPFILFRPRADGIVDMKQSNSDDWVTIGTGICPVIVNPGNTVTDPIRCAPSH